MYQTCKRRLLHGTMEAMPGDDGKHNKNHEPQHSGGDGNIPGSVFKDPFFQALKKLPHLTMEESALLDLYHILDKVRAPLNLFDQLLSSWKPIMDQYSGLGTQVIGVRLSLTNSLWSSLCQLQKQYTLPLRDLYRRLQYPKLLPWSLWLNLGPAWHFQDVGKTYLLNLLINLVNQVDSFGKYISNDPTNKELLAGLWYTKTYNERISDPNTKLFLPVDIYLDKTGKTAVFGSSCGEPVIWSPPIFKQHVHEYARAWHLWLGYISELELPSSAKKMKELGWQYKKGHNQNYHKILS